MKNYKPYEWSRRDIIGRHAALDFVNTVSHWTTERVDRIGGFDGLADWAKLAGVADQATQDKLKKATKADPAAAQRIYAKADKLRDALWRIFSAVGSGSRVDESDLAHLAEWARKAARYSELRQHEAGFVRQWTRAAPMLELPLLVIAQSAEELLERGPIDRLHICGGNDCEWMFLDLSKNRSRRWCDMATCGNETKVKNFRSRTKQVNAA